MRPTFPEWALGIAQAASRRSEDPYVQVGSVVASQDWMILGIGYNGLPPGINMSAEWWANRDNRRPFMIHAETNALRNCQPGGPYWVVSTHIPCATCMSLLGSYRVQGVYYERLLGAAHDTDLIMEIAKLNHVVVTQIGDNLA